MESAISTPYASIFEIDKTQEPSESHFYKTMSDVLVTVAEHYNQPNTDDIYMGYVEVASLILNLSDMCTNPMHEKSDLAEVKKMIQNEYKLLIQDLTYHFESYPDEITKRDIEVGKILIDGFNII